MTHLQSLPLKRQGYNCSVLVGGILKIETPRNETHYTDLERGVCSCKGYEFCKQFPKTCRHLRGGAELALQCLQNGRTGRVRDWYDFARLCRLTRYAWACYMDIFGRSSTLAKRLEMMNRYNRLQAAICFLTGMTDYDARRELLDNWQTTGQQVLAAAFNGRQEAAAKELVN